MDSTTLIAIVVIVAAIAVVGLIMASRQKSAKLRSQFGPEYERTLEDAQGRHKAERELREREKRVQKFKLHPISTEQRLRYADAWRAVQADFVDDPKSAVTRADALLDDVMAARGYPAAEFDERAANLSVDHPVFVQNYRSAHDIAERHERGEAGTEDLRQAMIHYRALFDDLIADTSDTPDAVASAA